MKIDTLNRRMRHTGRQPRGKRIQLTERDLIYFATLDRHGPLTTPYLFEFIKPGYKDYNGHQHRLKDLFNEEKTAYGEALLDRPWQQWQSADIWVNDIAYDLTAASRKALTDRAFVLSFRPTSPYMHQFMTAALTASIELAANRMNLSAIHLARILDHKACPDHTRFAKNPLAIGKVTPDALFGIEYPPNDGKKQLRFLALEADRGSETINPSQETHNSFSRKIKGYLDIRANRTYREHWGIPNLLVLTVTTSSSRMRSMIALVERLTAHDPKAANMFLFKTKEEFGQWWKTPPVMYDLFTAPWARLGGEFAIDK